MGKWNKSSSPGEVSANGYLFLSAALLCYPYAAPFFARSAAQRFLAAREMRRRASAESFLRPRRVTVTRALRCA